EDLDPLAVRRNGILAGPFHGFYPPFFALLDLPADFALRLRIGAKHYRPLFTVDKEQLPLSDLFDGRPQAQHRRNSQRPGHDGGMGRPTPLGRHHRRNPSGKLRRVGGGQFFGHHDASRFDQGRIKGLLTGKVQQQAVSHIPDIIRPGLHVLIGEGSKYRLHFIRHRCAHGFRILLLIADAILHLSHIGGIVQESQVLIAHRRLPSSPTLLPRLTQAADLFLRPAPHLLQTADLLFRILHRLLHHLGANLSPLNRSSQGQTGCSTHSAQLFHSHDTPSPLDSKSKIECYGVMIRFAMTEVLLRGKTSPSVADGRIHRSTFGKALPGSANVRFLPSPSVRRSKRPTGPVPLFPVPNGWAASGGQRRRPALSLRRTSHGEWPHRIRSPWIPPFPFRRRRRYIAPYR